MKGGGIYETLYSENEVNNIIEAAYSEGYEDAQRAYAKKDYEAYGDIDENAPDDANYEKSFEKWGKNAALGGTGALAAGVGLGLPTESKANKARNLYKKAGDAIIKGNWEANAGKSLLKNGAAGGPFENRYKDMIKRGENLAKSGKRAQKEVIKKAGKLVAMNNAGKSLATVGSALAAGGTALYVGSKLGQNARRTAKKDWKDVLVQADKERNK